MPTPDERLSHVALKIYRAKKHAAELNQQVKAFLDSKPYGVACRVDLETTKPIYYVDSVISAPSCLALIAGDVIQNLMTALDHLAFQIVCVDSQDKPPKPSKIYFPIFSSEDDYNKGKGHKLEGASPDSIAAIDALRPYKEGSDLLWKLGRLNNIEKHRVLLTVGSRAGGFNCGDIPGPLDDDPEWADHRKMFKEMGLYLVPLEKGFPLKPGFELLVGYPGMKPNPDQRFIFDVVIHEAGIVDGEPILELIHSLTTEVDRVVAALTARLTHAA